MIDKNGKMVTVKDLTDTILEEEYKSYHCLVNDEENGCFGSKDVIYLDMLEREIYRRGGIVRTDVKVIFKHDNDRGG